MEKHEIEAIQTAVDKVKPIHVWVVSYGMTHSYLVLHIHSGNYPRGLKLECNDCFYISGKTQHGSYEFLNVKTEKDETGEDALVIRADNDSFVVKCGSIHLSDSSKV